MAQFQRDHGFEPGDRYDEALEKSHCMGSTFKVFQKYGQATLRLGHVELKLRRLGVMAIGHRT